MNFVDVQSPQVNANSVIANSKFVMSGMPVQEFARLDGTERLNQISNYANSRFSNHLQ